jgi:hypothetical protein
LREYYDSLKLMAFKWLRQGWNPENIPEHLFGLLVSSHTGDGLFEATAVGPALSAVVVARLPI